MGGLVIKKVVSALATRPQICTVAKLIIVQGLHSCQARPNLQGPGITIPLHFLPCYAASRSRQCSASEQDLESFDDIQRERLCQ